MAEDFGPLYEVTHTLNRDIVADFDAWLSQHAHEMMSIQGIHRASTHSVADGEDGRPRRVSQYYFASESDLDNYLAGPAENMRRAATQLFGDSISVSRRVLRQVDFFDESTDREENCLNCSTVLAGQYCGECGQRAQNRLISVWELLRDAFGDLLELDSRLWRTLLPLMLRPGQLTRDYLEGRRARFMPPFRTYLVLSIVFFLVAFFDPAMDFNVLVGPDEQASVATHELSSDPEVIGNAETASDTCDEIAGEDLPEWLSAQRVRSICERAIADDGRAFAGKLLENIPAALIGLLPIMALILKVLYPLSKRYYVEHLLFVVHFHAAVFLILSLLSVFDLLTALVGLSGYITPVTTVAASLYIPIYLFKAMRQVYQQSRFATLLKFVVLLLSYMVGLLVIFLLTAAIAAITI